MCVFVCGLLCHGTRAIILVNGAATFHLREISQRVRNNAPSAQIKQSEATSATLFTLRVPKEFCPVTSLRPLGHRNPVGGFAVDATRSFSRSSSRRTCIQAHASSSAFVNPVALALTRYSPSFPRIDQRDRRVTHCTDWLVGLHEGFDQCDGCRVVGHVPHRAMSAGRRLRRNRLRTRRLFCVGSSACAAVSVRKRFVNSVWNSGTSLFGSSGG